MIDPQLLKSTIKVCMFDQYGTVVDMQTGLVEAATPFLKVKNWSGNPNGFVTWWRRTNFENSMIDALLGKEHTPYREIGERAVAFVMDRAGISHTPDEVHALVAAIERLKPFSEVPTALDRLRTRYKLAVLSNGDPRHAGDRAALSRHRLRPDHLRRRRQCLQAASPHL
jgi:2-haloacid dehalogenase